MLGYSEVVLLGNLVKEPDLKTFENNVICNNTVAINAKGRDGETNATFIDVSFWNKQAEILKQFATKGTPLFIVGRLKVSTYEKDGEKRVMYSVVASDFRILSYPRGAQPDQEPQEPRTRSQQQRRSTKPKYNETQGDDIPF